MRIFSLITVLFFAFGISAQSPAATLSFNAGMRSAASGEFEKALKSYRTALTLVENEGSRSVLNAKLHFNIGVCLYRMERPTEAISEFEEAIRLRQGNYQKAAYALGMAESARGNWAKAEQAFRAAIKLNENDGEVWFDLGFAYLNQADFRKAEDAFRNSIIYKSKDSALSHNNIGVILAMKSDCSPAEKEFEMALALTGGELAEARENLEHCKARTSRELIASLVFSRKKTTER